MRLACRYYCCSCLEALSSSSSNAISIFALNKPIYRSSVVRSIRKFSLRGKNLYQILEVPQSATQAEIKRAFYMLSKKQLCQYHPDVVGSNESSAQKFLEVKEAYDILRDEQKRMDYDRSISTEYHRERPADYDRYRYDEYLRQRSGGRGRSHTEEDFYRIWWEMNRNREFQRARYEFDEQLRKMRENAFAEQMRRRERNSGWSTPQNDPWQEKSKPFLGLFQKIMLIYLGLYIFLNVLRVLTEDWTVRNDHRRRIEEMMRRMP